MIPAKLFSFLIKKNILEAEAEQIISMSGGCIHNVYKFIVANRSFVIKFSTDKMGEALLNEAEGLKELKYSNFVIPEVISYGVFENLTYLLMEYLELFPLRRAGSMSFAKCLAQMHQITSTSYGFKEDNHIGATQQINTTNCSWATFFVENRLKFQLELLGIKLPNSKIHRLTTPLLQLTTDKLKDYQPAKSLLHGDLWSGNAAYSIRGPVIYDPAVYYGDRETDLAMMKLFSGFEQIIFDHYEKLYPLTNGSSWRCGLYQLYHLLNHCNLFGASYESQTLSLMNSLLSDR